MARLVADHRPAVAVLLLERTSEGELVPMARAMGAGVMPWSPLHGGLLSGKYSSKDISAVDTTRDRAPRGRVVVIDAVNAVTEELGVPSAQAPSLQFAGATVDGRPSTVLPSLRVYRARY
jgi:aryl-alcohol dehydrogenase-like predicted oxidoreductase